MEAGIPILTDKGRNALKNTPSDLTLLCRNILVQVDGNKSFEDILTMFRGLKGLDDGLQKLIAGGYVKISRECLDLVRSMARHLLGAKSPTLIKKVDELHVRHGDACWDHLEELDKFSRMFYGEVVADKLRSEIAKILRETRK